MPKIVVPMFKFRNLWPFRSSHRAKTSTVRSNKKNQNHNVLLDSVEEIFILLGLVAYIDKTIDNYETHIANQYAIFVFHLNDAALDQAMSSFYNASTIFTSHTQMARRIYKRFCNDIPFLLDLYDWLERISLCDGTLSRAEEQALRKIRKEFKMKTSPFVQKKDPYLLLGCESDASIEEIKKAYRNKIAQYHPDTIMAIHPPEEFVQHTLGRFQEIKTAYEIIRKWRRF